MLYAIGSLGTPFSGREDHSIHDPRGDAGGRDDGGFLLLRPPLMFKGTLKISAVYPYRVPAWQSSQRGSLRLVFRSRYSLHSHCLTPDGRVKK